MTALVLGQRLGVSPLLLEQAREVAVRFRQAGLEPDCTRYSAFASSFSPLEMQAPAAS